MKLYQLKIQLQYSKPLIWRKLLVPANIRFCELHDVIQTVMPWNNSHLHSFEILPPLKNGNVTRRALINARRLCEDDFDMDFDEADAKRQKAERKRLCDEVKEGDYILYNYDFGDDWGHLIHVEKVIEATQGEVYPQCIKAANACPPDDCGGIGGYYHLLDILEDPKHEEHKFLRDWMGLKKGQDYDPKYVDIAGINKQLSRLCNNDKRHKTTVKRVKNY